MGQAYPHKVNVQYTIPELRSKYMMNLHNNGDRSECIVTVAGRIVSKRSAGCNLHFITIQGDMELVQIISAMKDFDDQNNFTNVHNQIKRGDIIGVTGYPSLSKSGEFSVCATHLKLLSTCFHMLPDDYFGLSDVEQRYRQRYLDFIVNRKNIDTFLQRSRIIKYIRSFFDNMNFV
uniref:Lysine--tRNA ligase n=1 Tax=Lygus hesperus TaxID=30085 RepID=A0A0A9W570_LYGHE